MVSLKMPDINSVVIAGNLTSEPTFRRTTNGTPVANFCIACNRKFKDSSGQWRENVCFIGVVAWHKLAESCCEFLSKGSAVLVEGELQSRSWKSEDGSSSQVVEIKARRIQFLNKQVKKEEIELEPNQQSETTNESEADQDSPSDAPESNSEFDFGFQQSKF